MFPTRYLILFAVVVLALLVVLKREASNDADDARMNAATAAPIGSGSPQNAAVIEKQILETTQVEKPIHTHGLDDKNRDLIRRCVQNTALERLNLSSAKTLYDLTANLEGETQFRSMNVNVKRPDGKEQRLLILPHDPSTPDTYTVENQDARVFDVDSEGLPIMKPFPENLKSDSLEHLTNSFVAGDPIIFSERKTKLKINGGAASFTQENGEMTDVHFIFSGKTLGCAWQNEKATCACL